MADSEKVITNVKVISDIHLKSDESLATLSKRVFEKEKKYCANVHMPLPVAICKAKGVYVWDVEGKRYYDFLSAYSSVNQGHCHPEIIEALKEQVDCLTLPSRAFYSNVLGDYGQYITNYFGYDKVLPMNTGVEAGQVACKIARNWGYLNKDIPENKAKVIFTTGDFWGKTSSAVDPQHYIDSDSCSSLFEIIPFNNLVALREAAQHAYVCAFMIEPIQEDGVVVPDDGYLKGVREICTDHNVLWIANEVQTGLGRTGKKLCVDHEDVKPDILMVGKALSGGILPISAVLANNDIMQCVNPDEHSSTFSGNPLACRVAMAALKVIRDEKLSENAEKLGEMLRTELSKLPEEIVIEVRGKGLLNGLVFDPAFDTAEVCLKLKENGILASSTNDVVRLSPPLCITEEQLKECIQILLATITSLNKK